MKIAFSKYHGTGNDFIIIDDRECVFPRDNREYIERLCDRRYGIGADGLILVASSAEFDFHMIYYNADGNLSSFCGNGSRCIVDFTNKLDLLTSGEFTAIDGRHFGKVVDEKISVQMQNVAQISRVNEAFILDTGSPHYVSFHNDIDDHFIERAKAIRYSEAYKEEGINVNFVSISNNELRMRTYERGVEDETHSCGTGVTAVALVCAMRGMQLPLKIKVKGGELSVNASVKDQGFEDIWLTGPAEMVFEGVLDLNSK